MDARPMIPFPEEWLGPIGSATIIEIGPRQGDDFDDIGFAERWSVHPCVIEGDLESERRYCRSGRACFLSLEVFDLQDDFCRYSSFLIEHGIGERGLGDDADFSRDAEREIVDGTDGVFVEDGFQRRDFLRRT